MTSGAVGELPVNAYTKRPPTSPSRNLRITSCAEFLPVGKQGLHLRTQARAPQPASARRGGGRGERGLPCKHGARRTLATLQAVLRDRLLGGSKCAWPPA